MMSSSMRKWSLGPYKTRYGWHTNKLMCAYANTQTDPSLRAMCCCDIDISKALIFIYFCFQASWKYSLCIPPPASELFSFNAISILSTVLVLVFGWPQKNLKYTVNKIYVL